MNESEIVQVEDMQMAVSRPPEKVLAEAKQAAMALQSVIRGKAKPVKFNGEQYIEFEDWQVLARFYGLTAKIASTTPVDFGGVRGFEARAVVLDIKTGMEVSAADAMCLNDEDKWSSRAKYEYVNGQRTKTGDVSVPMFQLRSMAQTRACAKALRNVLAWVVVLAGYKPTPEEEMTGSEDVDRAPVAQPARTSAATPAVPSQSKPTPSEGKVISINQAKRFFALAKGSGKSDSDIKEYLKTLGIERSSEMRADVYEVACAWAEGVKVNTTTGEVTDNDGIDQ